MLNGMRDRQSLLMFSRADWINRKLFWIRLQFPAFAFRTLRWLAKCSTIWSGSRAPEECWKGPSTLAILNQKSGQKRPIPTSVSVHHLNSCRLRLSCVDHTSLGSEWRTRKLLSQSHARRTDNQ